MMGGTPPASTVNEALELLKVVVSDPQAAKAHLEAIRAAHEDLDARSKTLGDYETQLSARETAVAKREEAAKFTDATITRDATDLADAKAQHEAEKAAFDAAKAKELAAQEVTRLNVNRDAGVNKSAANKLAAQRDEMASQEVALRAMRVGLEQREKAVEEGEAALAAKQARIIAAMQGA